MPSEIWTTWMDLRKTQELVRRAQQLSHFSRLKNAMGRVVLHPMTLDDYPRQYVDVRSLTVSQLNFPRTLEDARRCLDTIENLESFSPYNFIEVEISDSGRKYNPEFSGALAFHLGTGVAPRVRVFVSEKSKAYHDLECRKELLGRILNALQLQDGIEFDLSNDKLALRSQTPKLTVLFGERHDLRDKKPQHGEVLLKARPTIQVTGRDVEFEFLGLAFDQVRSLTEWAFTTYAPKQFLLCKYVVICSDQEYVHVRAILNGTNLKQWEVEFYAESPFKLDELEQAMATYERFGFFAFSLYPPGIGDVGVDIYYEDQEFRMNFNYTGGKCSPEELKAFICELAGGEDIIDHDTV